ncbi:MAG: ComEA family DNA-binding protein [Myxococcota bacterium]
MSRTAALAVVALAVLAVGLFARLWWPSSAPVLDCSPAQVRWTDGGVAYCGRGEPFTQPPAGQLLTLGAKLDLNRATADDLALLPGVGNALAQAIVAARGDGGFDSWDEVDAVPGVGDAKLQTLKAAAEIRPR